ncbi:MAG: hypothetical protein Q8M24_16440 [Pseudolabrys sp.]|nr:hypothetical protein [Pseudolabrys sp.]MDP2297033.1 hypothetical protein [Pseudolabrys sp.]
MSQFYVPDEESAKRCHISRSRQTPDTFSGVDSLDGKLKTYTGVVQSVEDLGATARQARWRVTMPGASVK